MRFLTQIWTLTQKDLLIILGRRWLSTSVRALIFPIVLTIVLAFIRHWTATSGYYGIGSPTPIHSFSDALHTTGDARPKVIIINNGFADGDVGTVVDQLSSIIRDSGKELHVVSDKSQLQPLCPSSNAGISSCYGAVEFHGSPDHGPPGQLWNYTLYGDGGFGSSVDVRSSNNDVQLYSIPFQHAIDSAIATTHGGTELPQNVMQFPFTSKTEAQKEAQDLKSYEQDVQYVIAFAFFVALSGITYHCVGHITYQREQGMLALIDAMMPNPRWQSIAARILATHAAFDLVYIPGWIAMGAIMGAVAFPHCNVGYFILLNLLAGLALTSYSVLASSLFKRAQLSAISAIIATLVFALVAQFAEGEVSEATKAGVLATSVLFPPCNYVYFLIVAGGFAEIAQPMRLNEFFPPSDLRWEVTGATFLGLLVFQIIVYPILGAVIEFFLHSTASRARKVRKSEELDGDAVVLKGFTKEFKGRTKKKERVKAVNNFTFNLSAGSITVLLGANGSGKSTTLNAIAGLETVTQGSIDVDGTGGLGLCPQKNVMWNELTVREHVDFFENLKATQSKSKQAHKREVVRLISACDLDVKAASQSRTLSGGQKRKLQLAMMLAGGSRVCCIDEASSGIDPLARRKVWDILLAERGSRSLLLTTHFLDEAEVLSDHVAILSKGVLKAQGSVASLKSSMGGGYRLTTGSSPRIASLQAPPGVTNHSDYNQEVFEVPDESTLAHFVRILEQNGIHDYRLQGPTIEHVFLKLAQEMQGDSDLARELSAANKKCGNPDSESAVSPEGKARALTLNTGKGCGPLKQMYVLFLKRIIILEHNYMPYIGAMFIPLVLAGMVTRFFIGYDYPNGIPCDDPGSSSTQRQYRYTLSPSSIASPYPAFVYGPPSRVSPDELQRMVPNQTHYSYSITPHWDQVPTVASLSDFASYVAANATRLYIGGIFDDANAPTFAWTAGQGPAVYPPLIHSLLNSILMNQTIDFGYEEFAQSFTPSNGVGSLVAIFTVLGFAVYPGLFALYPTAERIRNVRAMHYSNGILSSSLWLAYALFDSMFILLISVLTVAIWSSQWNGWYALGYMFVVFVLYGLASTAYSYVVSLFVPSQLAAIAASSVIQVIVSMLYLVAYILSSSNAPATKVYDWFNYCHYTIALISPAANLLRALFMCLNQYSLICRGTERASYPGEIGIYGAPILYLIVQLILLAAFLMFWESGRSLEIFDIRTGGHHNANKQILDPEKYATSRREPDADAAEDNARLNPDNNGLRVSQVSKFFGTNHAVENVSFGLLPSEKFALLGPNGAGKSTMISLIRGDLRPTHQPGAASEIFIANDSLMHTPVAAKNHLGVCPQFDAQDSMTLREHLNFYARARGVPNKEANINELIERLGLGEHENKLARKLSGGTQRKLSLAIALIANPGVLLLDEPSSGMDPAAKRALWTTLSSITAGRVLLITTHSMEEADALCDRAGIMAGKLLALGGIEDLRQRHGNAIRVHLVHRDAPYTSVEDTETMKQWALRTFPGAEVEQRTFGGQLRFSVPKGRHADSADMGRLFKVIEEVKGDLGVVDYSIGPATLDQVFLNVVGKHNVQEENTNVEKGGKKKFMPKSL